MHKSTCFESHKEFDYLYLLVPSKDMSNPEAERIEVYLSQKAMLIFYEGESLIVDALVKDLLAKDQEMESLEGVLHHILVRLNNRHVVPMDEIEDSIADLEDALASEESRDYVEEISRLRKQLLVLRRYYEGLLAMLEDLEENRNGLFSEEVLRVLHFQTQKSDRLYHNVLNLRDYLTQVRESYQALLDIEANKVMKLFTVITAIFLPLTLLVGWYGMNLFMPEVSLRHTYPIVIGASVAIVVGCIVYFKRNRWF